jgi:hypothetical protein
MTNLNTEDTANETTTIESPDATDIEDAELDRVVGGFGPPPTTE